MYDLDLEKDLREKLGEYFNQLNAEDRVLYSTQVTMFEHNQIIEWIGLPLIVQFMLEIYLLLEEYKY